MVGANSSGLVLSCIQASGDWRNAVAKVLSFMPRAGKVSLMIVEDDTNIRFLLDAAAQRSGLFDPIVALPDGQAAFEVLRNADPTHLPALIVTDLAMPRMTGLELLRAIKSDDRTKNIPVAIITSSDLPDDRDLALGAGACSFVSKPYGVEALTRALIGIRESCEATRVLNSA